MEKEDRTIQKLKTALGNYFDELDLRDVQNIAKILKSTLKKEKISFQELKENIKSDLEDLLLQMFELKLLIPPKTSQHSLEWKCQLYYPQSQDFYKLPKIIKLLVENAEVSGKWNPQKAITSVFHKIGEKDWQKIPQLIEEMKSQLKRNQINGKQIRECCLKVGLDDKANTIIAELKGINIISPILSTSLFRTLKQKSPIYEFNPSLV